MDEKDETRGDESGEDIDVAALMGFGSFGDQHRGKRRRYNSRTDGTVVDGDASTSGKKKENGRGRGSGSGSNNLPLGSPRPTKGGGVGADEKTVGDGMGTRMKMRALGTGKGGEGAQGLREGDGDGVEPVGTMHAAAQQDEQTQASSDMFSSTRVPATTSQTNHSLPPKPPLPSTSHPSGSAPASRSENEAWKLRKGVRNQNGDVAYYDPSFVEDPWRELR